MPKWQPWIQKNRGQRWQHIQLLVLERSLEPRGMVLSKGLTSVVYGAGVGITAFFPERLSRNAKRTSSGSDRTTYARSIFHQVA